jgi:hypothetical protein
MNELCGSHSCECPMLASAAVNGRVSLEYGM